jgi:hypothetical protein
VSGLTAGHAVLGVRVPGPGLPASDCASAGLNQRGTSVSGRRNGNISRRCVGPPVHLPVLACNRWRPGGSGNHLEQRDDAECLFLISAPSLALAGALGGERRCRQAALSQFPLLA